jgi:hypothetical protein
MLARWILIAVAGSVALPATHAAQFDEPDAEYFIVTNDSKETITIAIRATNGDDQSWYTAVLEPTQFTRFTLQGFQPYKIWIWRPNLSAVEFQSVNLCTMMRQCRPGWNQDRKLFGMTGRMVPRGRGHIFQPDRRPRWIEFRAWVEKRSVSLHYGLVAGKQIDDPIPPEPKKRSRL